MAPANDADSFRIDFPMPIKHELSCGVNILDFQAAVVDLLPKIGSVPRTAAVIGRDHGVTLSDEFVNDLPMLEGHHVAVDLSVRQDNQRQFPEIRPMFRKES